MEIILEEKLLPRFLAHMLALIIMLTYMTDILLLLTLILQYNMIYISI